MCTIHRKESSKMGFMKAARTLDPFGMEIEIDPESELDEAVRNELQRLYTKEGLLVVRGLNLSLDGQVDFCRTFGPIPDDLEGNYFYFSNSRADGYLGNRELQWHNDVPYLPSPFLVGALHAVSVEPGATTTRF